MGTGDDAALSGENGVRSVLPLGGGTAYLFVLAVSIIGMAGEYRHGTIGHTLLAAPERWQIIVAKVIAYALVGLVFGALAVGLTYGISDPWMESKDAGWSLENTLPTEIIAGSLAGNALFGVIGVGLAALLKDQVLALFTGIGLTLLIDLILSGVVPEVNKFLPGGALSGLLNGAGEDLLDPPLGGLVLLGYAVLFVLAGALVSQRRDLT
ncbi:MAG: ABC transporter permease subunit [Solirubrobacterales bacterium]|nr:ABC transporter permease subunit [Solirubrobacterales bacterium]